MGNRATLFGAMLACLLFTCSAMAQEENRPCPHFLPPQDPQCAAQAEDAYQRELSRYKRELSREEALERVMPKLIRFALIPIGIVVAIVVLVIVFARGAEERRQRRLAEEERKLAEENLRIGEEMLKLARRRHAEDHFRLTEEMRKLAEEQPPRKREE